MSVTKIYIKGEIHKAIQVCLKILKNTTTKNFNKFSTKNTTDSKDTAVSNKKNL